jgi:hypothetical protein
VQLAVDTLHKAGHPRRRLSIGKRVVLDQPRMYDGAPWRMMLAM